LERRKLEKLREEPSTSTNISLYQTRRDERGSTNERKTSSNSVASMQLHTPTAGIEPEGKWRGASTEAAPCGSDIFAHHSVRET